jgi:hypothetical protein
MIMHARHSVAFWAAVLIATVASCAQSDTQSQDSLSAGATPIAPVAGWNPNGLAAAIRGPLASGGVNHPDATWNPPGHWRPWGGDWSADFWASNSAGGIDYAGTCNQAAYLKLSAWNLPGGVMPDRIRAYVAEQGTACASGNYADGGYYQKYRVFATYRAVEVELGWVVLAHLANPVYTIGTWIDDPQNKQVGTVFSGSQYSACWGSCHLHMEVFTADATHGACYYAEPSRVFAPFGATSVVGVVGGNLGPGGQKCKRAADESQLACSTWDGDVGGCDAHRSGTQDCAYYFCSGKCRPRGTSNCEAGCSSYCGLVPNESSPCSSYDGAGPAACDAHQRGQTQDCAFYFCSSRCRARGTSNCEAGCGGSCGSWR